MNGSFDISIAISSYNREDKVLKTLQSLVASDLTGIRQVDLLVIDDGSPRPVEQLIPLLGTLPPLISLRLLKQENAGIGATRNRGFAEAASPLVLFLDDDIILHPDTIRKMYEANVQQDGAVWFGSYPFVSHQSKSLEQFATSLFNYDDVTIQPGFRPVHAITSGLLCVNKDRLGEKNKFYRDDLTVPAAEEHEIIYRFYKKGIPIVHATHIAAIHNHHLTLPWLSNQQYKYGLATAEAFAKKPEILGMEKFAQLKSSLEAGGVRGMIKSMAASGTGKKILLGLARLMERIFPASPHNRLFGILTSAWFLAGYRAGKKRFAR